MPEKRAAMRDMAKAFKQDVIDGVQARFGVEETKRVVTAWKKYTEGEFYDDERKQKGMLMIEDLTAYPIWEEAYEEIEWVTNLEERWEEVREELKQVRDTAEWEIPVDYGWEPAFGRDWEILRLFELDKFDPTDLSTGTFPQTLKVLQDCGVPMRDAFFAKLKAGHCTEEHNEPTNAFLTAHLGLAIPAQGCRLVAGYNATVWGNGEVALFDGTFAHKEINKSEHDRYVLQLKVWHPDLTQVEQKALEYILDKMNQLPPPPPLRSKYVITVDGKEWKLPGPVFDVSCFGSGITLFDEDEKVLMFIQDDRHVYVEHGHNYSFKQIRYPNPLKGGALSHALADRWAMLIRQGDVVQWPKEPEGYEDDYRAQWPTLLAGPPDPDYDTVDPEYDEPLEDFDNDDF
jgi:aspartate beta-hydroxylase